MGQKVNPISMRLQVNKNWRSKWFASKRDYADKLTDDLKMRKLIDVKTNSRAAINRIDIERSPNQVTVTIQTGKAGVVIGRGGAGVNELKAEAEKIYKTPVRINIEEIKKPELYAKLVAENIANQLERRIAFRRAIKQASAASMRAGAKGIRIEVAGRLNGAEMSRREKEVQGSVPLHTVLADIDYAHVGAKTPAGVIGVKVWEKLSAQEKEWVQQAANESALLQRKLWAESEENSLKEMKEAGVVINYPDKTPFIEKVQPLLDSYSKYPDIYSYIQRIQQVE